MRALPLVVVLVFGGSVSWAGVENTHHDMRLYSAFEEQSVCSYCHVPHGAMAEENLFARTSEAEGLGPVGVFCYSCHDGTVVPTALVEAPDGTVGLEALTRSHGVEIERIGAATGGLETAARVLASGLVPIKDPKNPPRTLDCNACHDPHSDQYPPFLKVPLATLCERCHGGRDGVGGGRWTAVTAVGLANHSHPVGMPVGESGYDKTLGMTPEMTFHGPDRLFDRPTPTPQQLRAPAEHWETGGHLSDTARNVMCSTCHCVHLPKPDLLVARAGGDFDKTVCAGCHGRGQNPEDPGATGFYHPVLDSSRPPYVHEHASHGVVEANPNLPATGELELFVSLPPQWPLGAGGELLCLTCHRTHQGVEGKRLQRAGPGGARVQCNECHGVGEQKVGPNLHHPVGEHDYVAEDGFPKELGWAWGPGLPGDLSDGLQCVDCHSDLARSAHNWL